ncbi:hypothetical protein J4558_10450 [Leptolyngbya sp. 15MV]|nr:hypothetical protein J4558_10450 [Leptolyngbya sp. 15MV]
MDHRRLRMRDLADLALQLRSPVAASSMARREAAICVSIGQSSRDPY